MRFRTKLFLVISIPAILLVSAAVAVSLLEITHIRENDAQEDLNRMRETIEGIHSQRLKQVQKISAPFSSVRVIAMVGQHHKNKAGAEFLLNALEKELAAGDIKTDFLEVRDAEGKLLARKSSFHQ